MKQPMKDSRIPWIGQIPEEWKLAEAKFFVNINHGSDPKLEGDIPVYGSGATPFKTCGEYKEGPAVLVGRKGTIDIPQFINGKFWNVDTAFNVKPKKFNIKLYYYLAQCFDYKQYQTSTAIPSMTQGDYSRMILPIPPLTEQEAIASYLDSKCKEIDGLVAIQERMIEELKAYRQSVITEAVTKGLNPNAPLKDSGIPWIGQIPKHWEVCKTLYVLQMPITDGPHITPELFEEGIPFISAEAVSCGNGSIDFNHMRGFISESFYKECCLKYTPQIDDVYMIKSGATTGKVSIVDTSRIFTIWSPLAVLRSNKNRIKAKLLFYSLQADYYQKQIQLKWSFGTQQNIGMRTIESLQIILPPLAEQEAIVTYLDTKCKEIDELISIKQKKIARLKEFKKSMIYEYVTGKKQVAIN